MPMAILFLALFASLAIPVWAVDLTETVQFHIAAQRLSSALLEFSHQAKIQIIVAPDIGERTTHGISGPRPIGDALTARWRVTAADIRARWLITLQPWSGPSRNGV
jgi:hypothetical protein